jgi:hypothetical protein
MATLQQTSPASLRSGFTAAHEVRGNFAAESRPYLVTSPPRKAAKSTQQYLALFPHESEDARITGATRSLYRRLLALNLREDNVRSRTGTIGKEPSVGSRMA